MFRQYFTDKTKHFLQLSESSDNGEALVQGLRDFFTLHLPPTYQVLGGDAIDSFGKKVADIDLIINRKLHAQIWEMMGHASPIEQIYGVVLVVNELNEKTLTHSLDKIQRFKQLAPKYDVDQSRPLRKIPASIFAFRGTLEHTSLKDIVIRYNQTNDLPAPQEVDLICALQTAVLVKDWHANSMHYRSIRTGEDTLMWYYILLYEYIVTDHTLDIEFNYRAYLRDIPQYPDY